MNKFLTLVTVLTVSVFYSCGSGGDAPVNDSLAQVQAARKLYLDKIDSAEARLGKTQTFDSKLALEALRAYNDFIVKYPNDTLTPEYLFVASDIAQSTGNYQQAAVYLETILENHLNFPKYADACFAAAFVYDTHLENVGNGADRARELYDFIIKTYPNSSYAEQSKVLKEYIGKPDSVLINDVMRKAEENQKKSPDVSTPPSGNQKPAHGTGSIKPKGK